MYCGSDYVGHNTYTKEKMSFWNHCLSYHVSSFADIFLIHLFKKNYLFVYYYISCFKCTIVYNIYNLFVFYLFCTKMEVTMFSEVSNNTRSYSY